MASRAGGKLRLSTRGQKSHVFSVCYVLSEWHIDMLFGPWVIAREPVLITSEDPLQVKLGHFDTEVALCPSLRSMLKSGIREE